MGILPSSWKKAGREKNTANTLIFQFASKQTGFCSTRLADNGSLWNSPFSTQAAAACSPPQKLDDWAGQQMATLGKLRGHRKDKQTQPEYLNSASAQQGKKPAMKQSDCQQFKGCECFVESALFEVREKGRK